MKRILTAAAAGLACLAGAASAADVGVSISIGQPGFYGRIDIGDFPVPAVIYTEPVVVERVTVVRPPIYLRVPPSHSRDWRRYCHRYGACGERVYFVRDEWYEREYVPRYRERYGYDRGDDRHGKGRKHHGDHGRGHGHGHDD